MNADLAAVAWPAHRVGDALLTLARAAGLPAGNAAIASPVPAEPGEHLDAVAGTLGLEAEEIDLSCAGLDEALRSASPALLRAPGGGFLALAAARGRGVELVAPDGSRRRARREAIRRALLSAEDTSASEAVESLLARAALPASRRERAASVLLAEWLGQRPFRGCWAVREPSHAPLRRLLSEAGVFRHLRRFALASAADFALLVLGWAWIGRAALEGRGAGGWLVGWALVIATAIPLRVVAAGEAVRTAIQAGAVVKQRLLAGALRMDPERLRGDGAGRLFARVLDAEALESLALSGGLATAIAAVQLVLALPVVALGAAGAPLAVVLAAVLAAGAAAARSEWRARSRAAAAGLDLTHDLVERMVGYRTRLAQEPRSRRHEVEDQLLERHLVALSGADASAAATSALVPRGWLLGAVAVLGLSLAGGSPPTGALAIAIGAILLVAQSLRQLVSGVSQLMSAVIAWREVAPLLQAAAQAEPPGVLGLFWEEPARPRALEAHALQFRFPTRASPVLRGATLVAPPGARMLLEGPSGGGKTAFASVLAGLRRPQGGLVLFGGADPATLGSTGWRRLVAYAPQFHENHLLAGTLAFNLLMGRGWPPTQHDVDEAEALCRELGLGPLLSRMPSGINQPVGDMGWQLSHGERSRVFLARALLQRPEVLILDESFGALDPETAACALRSVLDRARTLLVIAHP